jgi:protein-L-isoaspartate O-methyltransferase
MVERQLRARDIADERVLAAMARVPRELFVPEGERRTMAELSDAEKDAISHRGRAARALLAWLRP